MSSRPPGTTGPAGPPGAGAPPLLRVTDLRKHFPAPRRLARGGGLRGDRPGPVRAVDGISFEIGSGEVLALVGESGCGKSTTGRLLTRLLDPTGGTVELDGRDVTRLSGRQLRPFRRDVQMVFQDPYSSLNPRHPVGSIIGAGPRIQKVATERGRQRDVQELLELVGLGPDHYDRFPHELSGGQRQRVGIARALALRPRLVICDEPVSALDMSVQAQIVNLLTDLRAELGLSYLLISHDLSVVRHAADRVAVMYLGRLMEVADRDPLYARPLHPYTQALMAAVPQPDPAASTRQGRAQGRVRVRLEGEPPNPADPPSGCVFRTRCPRAQDRCATEVPLLEEKPGLSGDPGHLVACHFPGTDEAAAPRTPRPHQ